MVAAKLFLTSVNLYFSVLITKFFVIVILKTLLVAIDFCNDYANFDIYPIIFILWHYNTSYDSYQMLKLIIFTYLIIITIEPF